MFSTLTSLITLEISLTHDFLSKEGGSFINFPWCSKEIHRLLKKKETWKKKQTWRTKKSCGGTIQKRKWVVSKRKKENLQSGMERMSTCWHWTLKTPLHLTQDWTILHVQPWHHQPHDLELCMIHKNTHRTQRDLQNWWKWD